MQKYLLTCFFYLDVVTSRLEPFHLNRSFKSLLFAKIMINPFTQYSHFGKRNNPDSWLISSTGPDIILWGTLTVMDSPASLWAICRFDEWVRHDWQPQQRIWVLSLRVINSCRGDAPFVTGDLGQQPPPEEQKVTLAKKKSLSSSESSVHLSGETPPSGHGRLTTDLLAGEETYPGTGNTPIKYVMMPYSQFQYALETCLKKTWKFESHLFVNEHWDFNVIDVSRVEHGQHIKLTNRQCLKHKSSIITQMTGELRSDCLMLEQTMRWCNSRTEEQRKESTELKPTIQISKTQSSLKREQTVWLVERVLKHKESTVNRTLWV